jgi:hypothetical protein
MVVTQVVIDNVSDYDMLASLPQSSTARGLGAVCFARYTVPVKLRGLFGRKAFTVSTGLANPSKAVANVAGQIAAWRGRIEQTLWARRP